MEDVSKSEDALKHQYHLENDINQQHVDPFEYKDDVCDGCDKKIVNGNSIPCIMCCGGARYCCTKCLWDHRGDHDRECTDNICDIANMPRINGLGLAERRKAQVEGRKGLPKLMQKLFADVSKETLIQNFYFIRLPYDTSEKMTVNHPIKQIPQKGSIKYFRANPCLKDTYAAYLRHYQLVRDDGIDWVYIFTYTPDFQFVMMTAMPYQEQEYFEHAVPPYAEIIACPCLHHTPVE